MNEVLLEGQGLTRRYRTDRGRVLTACRDVDITLSAGETLGIVGESGCGKSTLLRLLTRLEKPDEGKLLFRGKDVTGLKGEALRRDRRHIQMVFQDPAAAFFPRMKAGEAIIEPLLNFNKLTRQQRLKRQEELLELVQLPKEYADRYPHSMSGGQRQRLGIARALALDPEILICDEATAALDVSVQKRIIDLLMEIQRRRRLGIIFVSHDLALVQSIAHRVMVMYLGGAVECLPGEQVWERACHPYSRALIHSVFTVDMDFTKPITLLDGDIPSPLDMPPGCAFHVRCPQRMEQCRQEAPPFHQITPDHRVACHLFAHQKKG